jgi:hypothetical protein
MGILERIIEGFKAPSRSQGQRRPSLTLAEALPGLMPKVRPRFLYETLSLGGSGSCPRFRPLGGIFGMSLVVDSTSWEVDVTEAHLEAWNADFDALHQRARANLARRSSEDGFEQVRPGLFRSTWQDNLDGSRILLPGLLRRLPVLGDPVVVLPNRDTLLVAGSEDPQALCWILEAAHQFMWGDPRAMNGCPLKLEGYDWAPWEAPEGHPAARLLGRLGRRRLVMEYTHQKDILDRINGRNGTSVDVASFHLEELEGGAVASRTYLPRTSQEGWLPLADQVGVLEEDRRNPRCLWVPWAEAKARLGDVLEPLGMFPERYRVRPPSPVDSRSWAGFHKAG